MLHRIPGGKRLTKRFAAVLAAMTVGAGLGIAIFQPSLSGSAPQEATPQLLVEHRPPRLPASITDPVVFTYQTFCPWAHPETPAPCKPSGHLEVRKSASEPVRSIALADLGEGRFDASVVLATTNSLEYRAVFFDANSGLHKTLPPTGFDRVTAMPSTTYTISLGTHEFGRTTDPTETVISGGWGKGLGQFGLDAGSEQATIGPAAFSIGPDGALVVADQVNGRLLLKPAVGELTTLPVAQLGLTRDVVFDGLGNLAVLNMPNRGAPLVSTLSPAGALLSNHALSQGIPEVMAVTAAGTFAQTHPSSLWEKLPTPGGTSSFSGGLPLDGQRQLLLDATNEEVRVAVTTSTGVERAWRITSATTLGEVQLARVSGDTLDLVVRTYTEHPTKQAEFTYLRIVGDTVTKQFNMPAVEWAETSALSQFELGVGGLYQTRSTPDGFSIVRFALSTSDERILP